MQYKYIIWDFDGTVVDTYGTIVQAFCEALQSRYELSLSNDRILDLVKTDTKYCASVLAKEYSLDEKTVLSTARDYYDKIPVKDQNPFPFVRELCEKVIDSGGKNYIVTHRDSTSLWQHLKSNCFVDFFSDVISEDDGFPNKPDQKK